MLTFTNLAILFTAASPLLLGVNAHAGIIPALGVQNGGNLQRSDVQRPSGGSPCGNGINIQQAISSSTPANLVNGVVQLTGKNFNGGQDGSLQFKAQVDPTATGSKFVPATVTQNGPNAPSDTTTVPITVQLPPGTTCSGPGGTCLISLVQSAGFGNCVLVKQQGGGGGGSATPPPSPPPSSPPQGNGNSNPQDNNNKGKGKGKGGQGKNTIKVKSGDTCIKIAQANGVSLDQIFKLNPSVNQGCTNLQIGQRLAIRKRSRIMGY